MRGAGVAPARAAPARPARDLEALEPVRGGPIGDVHQERVRERSGQQAESHLGRPSIVRRPCRLPCERLPAGAVVAGHTAPGTGSRTTSTHRPSTSALGDRLVDEHLVVAVRECRVGRVLRRGRPRRHRHRSARNGRRRCRRTPPSGRPGALRPRDPTAPMSAGFLMRISLGRSRCPSHSRSGSSRIPGDRGRRAVDLVAGANSSDRR